MKRSSSSLNQQVKNNDDESPQASYAKMARHSPSRFDHRRQEIPMDQRVVRQDLLYSLDGIFLQHLR